MQTLAKSMRRVAVIGAGPSGLVTLLTLEKCKHPDLEVICYERDDQPGGEWVFTDKVGTDEYGLSIHGSMYRGMRTNLPKTIMTIHPDFPWPKDVADFPYRERVLQYFQDFASHFSLHKYIKFRHYVHCISKAADNSSKINLDLEDLSSRSKFSEVFDFVYVCNGKYGKHNVPHTVSQFTGKALHYHDLKDPKRFAGERILIVGGAFGAMDMVIHLAKLAKQLFLSYHTKPPFFNIPSEVSVRPEIDRFENKTVYFKDESSCEVDVLLYATGFCQVHPLSPDLDLDWASGKIIFYPLYKHVVHPTFPSLFFVGKSAGATILASRVQAAFACAVMTGHVKLPTSEKMLQSIAEFKKEWEPKIKTPTLPLKVFLPKVELEFKTADEVAEMAGCQPIPAFMKKIYYALINLLVTGDILNYKTYSLELTCKEHSKECTGDCCEEIEIHWNVPEQ